MMKILNIDLNKIMTKIIPESLQESECMCGNGEVIVGGWMRAAGLSFHMWSQ